ncbi:MAG: autotransporter domain-containing protein [Endomicrobium sp.]|nr:autotransporter domain-containing protein [Endomicrobium sp.]
MKKILFFQIVIAALFLYAAEVFGQTKNHELYATNETSVLGNFAETPLRYRDNKARLNVTYMSVSTFSGVRGLTFNQKEVAKAVDKISLNPSSEWETAIDHFLSDLNEREQRHVLSNLSGYFLANVIRNAAADSPSDEIYDKARNHAEEDATNNGLWMQAKGGREIFMSDENSLGDYKDSSFGAMMGYDRYIGEKGILYGIYARVHKDDIEQKKNKAEGKKGGIGLYGGYLKEGWELKGMLLGSMDKFETKREVMDKTAKATIDAITISADIEGALNFGLTQHTTLRPFIGIEAEDTKYKSFNEKHAGQYNLKVKSGNYLRSAARIGIGAKYERKIFSVYADVEARYLITGNKPEIKSVFENTNIKFTSRGSEEGQFQGGVGAGIEAKIIKSLKIFANVNAIRAEKYAGLMGNAGIRFVFGKKDKSFYKDMELAKSLAGQAYEESEKAIIDRSTREDAEQSLEYAVQSLILVDKLETRLGDNTSIKSMDRVRIAKELEEIADTAKTAEKRLTEYLYGIKELEEAKNLVKQDEDIIKEIEKEIRKDEVNDELVVIKAKFVIRTADEALEKLNTSRNKLSLANGKLSDKKIEDLQKETQETEERALAAKIRALQLLEYEKTKLEEAQARRRNPKIKSLRLNAALFKTNDAALSAQSEKDVRKVVHEISKYEYKKITVEGHTDNTGTHEFNMLLSKRRARAVGDKLIEYGVDADKLEFVGFAETIPIKTNATKEGRAANRRTEIFIE